MSDWYDDRYRSRYGRGRDFDRYGSRNRYRNSDLYGSGYYDENDYGYGRSDYDPDRDFTSRDYGRDYGRGASNSGYGYDDESDEDFYYRNRGITGGNRGQFGRPGYGSSYGGRYNDYYSRGEAGRGYGSGRMSGTGRNPSGYGYSSGYSGNPYGSSNRGYNSGNTGRGTYGGGNYGGGNYDRDYDYNDRGRYSSNYGSGYGGSSYYSDQDYDNDFDYDFYETDYEPGYWSYTEYWLIPGPYSGMGPQGYQRSDDRIEEDVCDRLTQHGQIDASQVNVQVQDGVVTLTGTVDDRHAKRLAEDTIESVSGVKDVQNQLKVRRKDQQQSQGQHGQTMQQGQQMQTGQRQGQATSASSRDRSGGEQSNG